MGQNQQIVSIDEFHPLLLNIGKTFHHGDWNWKNVNSPFMRIFYILEGHAQLHMPSGTYELRPGHIYCIPAFTTHSYSGAEKFRLFYLHIYEDQKPHLGFLENYEYPVEIPSNQACDYLIRHLYEINPEMELKASNPSTYDNDANLVQRVLINKQRELATRIESRGMLYELLSYVIKEAKPKQVASDPRIQNVLNYICKNLSNPITIDELADEACLSKDHLIRLFKKETGESPLQFIIRKKMERAQLLLLTMPSPVKSIAYMLGFDDYSYFIRLFKRHVGVSPLEYRKKN